MMRLRDSQWPFSSFVKHPPIFSAPEMFFWTIIFNISGFILGLIVGLMIGG